MRKLIGVACLLYHMSACQGAITSAQAKSALGTTTGLKSATGQAGKVMTIDIVGGGEKALIVMTMLEAAGGAAADSAGWVGIATGNNMIGADPLLAWQDGSGEWQLSHRKALAEYVDPGDAGASASDFALVPALCSKAGDATAVVAFTRALTPSYTTDSKTSAWTLDDLDMMGVRSSVAPSSATDTFSFHDLASATFKMTFTDFAAGGSSDDTEAPADEEPDGSPNNSAPSSKASAPSPSSKATTSRTGSQSESSGSPDAPAAAEQVAGSSCSIKEDSPYAPYASFFQCSTAAKGAVPEGSLANAVLLGLGLLVVGLLY